LKLRVKVKHLVLGGLSIVAALTAFQFVVSPKLELRAAVRDYEEGKAGGKKSMLAAIDNAESPSKRWELIRRHVIASGSESPSRSFDVYVGPGSTMSLGSPSGESRLWSWEEKLPYLVEYANEGPDDIDRLSATKQVAGYYASEGRTEDAMELLERIEERSGGDRAKALKLERAKLAAEAGDQTQAMRLVEELEADPAKVDGDFGGRVAALKAALLVGKGKAEEALKEIDRELAAVAKRKEEMKEKFPDSEDFTMGAEDSLTSLRGRIIRALDENAKKSGTVSGAVTRSDGKPMARIGVFLRAERDVYHSILESEPYQAFTDAQGHYEFKNVIPGNYQLYIGLLYDQIDGWTYPTMNDDWIDVGSGESLLEDVELRPLIGIREPADDATEAGPNVRFTWEPVEGAASYTLYGKAPIENGVSNLRIQERISGNSVELPVDRLYEAFSGIYLNDLEGKIVVVAKALLGMANPELRYSWFVEAYDANGRLLTRSDGYRLNEKTMGPLPFFYLKERELNSADRQMLTEKPDEALAEYRKAYEADLSDRHSLRMIARIYAGKASASGKRGLQAEEIPYLEKLAELRESSAAFTLFEEYATRKNWEKAERYYRIYDEASDGVPGGYALSRYATVLMQQRRIPEAAERFREAMESDPSHRFVGNFLAVELYAGRTLHEASRLAEAYPERAPYDPGTPVWQNLIAGLEKERDRLGDAAGYAKELKTALESYFDGDAEAMGAIRLPALKAFAHALRGVD